MLKILLQPSTWATHFPMVRAGGLFILIVGIAILAGALFPSKRSFLLILGFIVAGVMIVLFAARLTASFGNPAPVQLWFLFGAIAFEFVLIRFTNARYRQKGEQALLLATLFVVGLHFLPMAVAFGPVCFALGLVLCAWSGIGLRFAVDLPLDLL
jgi:hypothetical protein